MEGIMYVALNLAVGHLLLSALMLGFAQLLKRSPAVSAEWRAGLLLAALLATVLLPLSPLLGTSSQMEAPVPFALAADVRATGAADLLQVPAPLALVLFALWCAGSTLCLLRLAQAQARLRKLIASATPAPWAPAYRARLARILLTDDFGPAATGVLRPVILIPRRLTESTADPALRAALLHEQAHLDRGDPAILWLQRLIEALCWWNPLLRRLTAELETAREVSCDLRAARQCGSRAEYADLLLDLVERRRPGPQSAIVPAMTSIAQLSARIAQVLDGQRAPSRTHQYAAASALVVAIGLSIAAQAAGPRVTPISDASAAPAAKSQPPTPVDVDLVDPAAHIAAARQRQEQLQAQIQHEEAAFIAATEAAEARYVAQREQAEAAYMTEREAAEKRYMAVREHGEREFKENHEREQAAYRLLQKNEHSAGAEPDTLD